MKGVSDLTHALKLFFFLMTWNITKAWPWGVNHGCNPTHQNHVSRNPRELLLGIEPKMSGSSVHPKPPTTRVQPNEYAYT